MIRKSQWLAADLLGQLIMLCPAAFLLSDEPAPALAAYFSVGSWQVVSCLRWYKSRRSGESRGRRWYRLSLCTGLILAVLTLPFGGLFIFFIVISPVLAVWYLLITLLEMRVSMDKEWRDATDTRAKTSQ